MCGIESSTNSGTTMNSPHVWMTNARWSRDLRGARVAGMAKMLMDFTHAWRSLRRRRAYFFTCAATLALVLGANAAIFAVVSATLIRPLPFVDRERVVQLFMAPPGLTDVAQRNPLQQMDFLRFRERARTMTRLEGFYPSERVVTQDGEPAVVESASVTPGLLQMLNAPVQAGRGFLTVEEQPGHDVALVTDGYWRRVLGGAEVIGRPIVIDAKPHTIVGVLGHGFPPAFLNAQILTPMAPNPTPLGRNPGRSVVTLAALAPGASVAAADAEARALTRQLAQEFPRTHAGWTGGAQSARQWQYGAVRAPILVLFAAASFVLLIACANIANLTSAQAAARSTDFSLRLALGATSADVLRLQFAELLILSVAGLVPGLVIASAAVPALLALDPVATRALGPVTIDWRVQVFTAAVAVLTAVVASIVPAARTITRTDVRASADAGRRTLGSQGASRLRRGLVITQVALSLALLMGGAVLVSGLQAISRIRPGYDPHGILTAHVRLPDSYSTAAARAAVVDRLLARVRALPGVTSASTTMNAFVPGFAYQTTFNVENRPSPDGQPYTTHFRRVSPGYFDTMRIAERRGRTFGEQDVADQPAVAVISQRVADQLFPGEDPVGRVLRRTAADAPPLTIIGVVDDVRDVSLTQAPEGILYMPWAQSNNTAVPVGLVIRTTLDPVSLIPAVRSAVSAVDPALPLRNAQPLEAFLSDSLAPERFRTMVLGIVAGLGLLLAALGIYGVTYRGIVDRTHEFAVRLALGSERQSVVRMVIAEAFRDVAAGAAAGVVAGFVTCALLSRLVENVSAAGPLTTVVAVSVLASAAFAASLIPALRILGVEPADALRTS
jgi:putative ABC transport system permease protein